MLLSLRIENFALIDRLELDLGAGLTVLTGETGAGKSIILDALDAALGGRVTGRAVRTGAERAVIEANFRLNPALENWLAEQQIASEHSDYLTCSREIIASGSGQRNRSRINGAVVNKQQMEVLRDRLVEITAQGQTMQLGQPALQRAWLDSYGGVALLTQREQVAAAFANYQRAVQALDKRRRAEQQRLQQLDLFDYQLRELNTANLSEPDELEQLEQEAKRLSHSVELQQQSYQIYQALYQNDTGAEACADLLGRAEDTLRDMAELDNQLQPILELVSTALAQVQEAGREINAYGEGIESDPQRLQDVQNRIVELKQVCRKYGPTLADAIELRDRLHNEMQELTDGGHSMEVLEQTVRDTQAILTQACAQLTQQRQKAAQSLESRLVAELKPLAMDKVQFQVAIQPCTPTATGADQITFLFSPNPGEPLQPLTDIASGGEMSRFLLALQASFSQVDPVGTLVFDEIDVGVSGRVSQAIAEKLHQLSQDHQVLCITHQPLVAAMADHHFRVLKQVIDQIPEEPGVTNGKTTKRQRKASSATSTNGQANGQAANGLNGDSTSDVRTVVRLNRLDHSQRREELAQLAGGQTAQEAIAFAESLLAKAANLRQSETVASTPAKPSRSTTTKARAKVRKS